VNKQNNNDNKNFGANFRRIFRPNEPAGGVARTFLRYYYVNVTISSMLRYRSGRTFFVHVVTVAGVKRIAARVKGTLSVTFQCRTIVL
jgi:hypothetical protein